MFRPIAIAALCAPFVLLPWTSACSGPELPDGPARRVILITCDTLRADRLGAYGYERDLTPALDAFAAEAVVFEEAYACAPLTGPAISSLLTGRLPDEIGVSPGNLSLMPESVETLAEVLRDAGFATGAVVSNWVLRGAGPELGDVGVSQGFEHFDDRMEAREKNRKNLERLAPATTAAAIAWLEQRRSAGEDRFFLWVHYQDPHGPYTPPPEVAERFAAPIDADPPLPVGENHRGRGQLPAYQLLDGERRPGVYRNLYDAEIRFFDEALGELLAWLEARGWVDDSLIVFTADHGESLGEHDYWFCHGEHLYRELVRVPFLVRYPRAQSPLGPGAAGSRVEHVASHLDLWPTVLEALGLPVGDGPGRSLLAVDAGEPRVVAQLLGRRGRRGRRVGVSDGRYRLLVRGRKAAQLFDIRDDPLETRNLATREPERVRELMQALQEILRASGEPLPGVRRELSSEDIDIFRGLGYVEGDEGDDEDDEEEGDDDGRDE